MRPRPLSVLLTVTTLALFLGSCNQSPAAQPPVTGTTPQPPQPDPAVPARTIVGDPIAVTFSGLDTAQPTVTTRPLGTLTGQALTSPSGVTVGTGATVRSVTDVVTPGQARTSGFRYLHVTLPVSVTGAPVTNLTLLGVALTGNAGGTAISALNKYPGGTATPFTQLERDALARQIRPTSPVTQDPFAQTPALVRGEEDALQVYFENEVSGLTLPAGQTGSVLPYGFVGHAGASRTVPVGTNTGTVTLAVKIPLQAAAKDDPYTVTLTFVPVQDSVTAVTESLEAQLAGNRAAFQAALTRLGGATLKTLPGSALFSPVSCNVRVAGPAGAPTEVFAPGTASGPRIQGRNAVNVGRSASVTVFTGCEGLASTTNVKARGFQSRGSAQIPILSSDRRTLTVPSRTGGYFPGEEVEVSLTAGLGGTGLPHVFRYRAAAGVGPGTFGGTQNVSVGRSPISVVVGDVDGDGDLDALSANRDSGSVSVRLNDGRGTFSGTQNVGVDINPFSVAVGDVDGDSDLDLLIANYASNSVSVRLNNGRGNFGGTQDVSVGIATNSVAVGDVDGDGDLDLLSANRGSGSVSVRLNNGSGTFSGTQNVRVGGSPISVMVGDVDGDGDLDLLSANGDSSGVSVRLNDGAGNFSGTQDVSVGTQPASVAVGDVDGDGDLDLLTANSGSNNVSVRLNGGSGTFSGTQNVRVGAFPQSAAVGDVDGDGDLDLLSANGDSSGVSVRLNDGAGNFSGTQNVSVGAQTASVAVGDVDGDGDLDLLSANVSGNTVSVRLNQP
ncbi:FG-GAP repeat domain-containing protein [Deinococcus sp. ME38]|uniref:FG-GAP repeat domain-containing protein n=1 Tax=Deinococcus sp. ME38 TaxID=3400344 RepID=UPI003B5B4E85